MFQTDYDPQIAAEHAAELAEKGLTFMGVDVFDPVNFRMLLLRFAFNLIVCWVVIRFFYYPKSRRKDYFFTFMLFSVTIFLLLFLLQSIPMEIGFALGLFAIFGMIRYRTETVQIREMTYLFVVIGISVVNGLSVDVPVVSVVTANLLFLLVTWLLESNRFIRHTSSKMILYEKIALIKPENREALMADLANRTGLNILKVEMGHIDFLRDVAFLKVYYKADTDEINTIDLSHASHDKNYAPPPDAAPRVRLPTAYLSGGKSADPRLRDMDKRGGGKETLAPMEPQRGTGTEDAQHFPRN
jgi:hypothetical protein